MLLDKFCFFFRNVVCVVRKGRLQDAVTYTVEKVFIFPVASIRNISFSFLGSLGI